jgi:hypothetical protein
MDVTGMTNLVSGETAAEDSARDAPPGFLLRDGRL